MQRDHYIGIVLLLAAAAAGTFFAMLFGPYVDFQPTSSNIFGQTTEAANEKFNSLRLTAAQYQPPMLAEAPPEIRNLAIEGHALMWETKKLAGDHVGASLNCVHCHFDAGATRGGKNGGVSLVGAAARYPRYQPSADAPRGETLDLAERINACFIRNMNGKRLSRDSRQMLALLAYLHWISKGIPIYADVEWAGLKPLEDDRRPDADAGKQVFTTRCAVCHGAEGQGTEGQGTEIAPPTWGPHSFTTTSDFGRAGLLATFIYFNMPRHNPFLTKKEAIDASVYVLAQPRAEPTVRLQGEQHAEPQTEPRAKRQADLPTEPQADDQHGA